MANRRANGEGSICYDKRRQKPYRVKITVGWEVDPKTNKMRQVTKDIGSFKTKGEASKALAKYLDAPYNLDDKNITFSELYEKWEKEYLEKHKSEGRRVKAAYKYCSSLYNKKMRNITILDMKQCINNGTVIQTNGEFKGESKNASPEMKEMMKYIFNHLFDYALEARIVEHNYAREFKLDKEVNEEKENNRKVKIPFSQEEMKIMWENVNTIPFVDMILYACYSGWRPTELIELRIENVNLEEGYVTGGIKTKAGKNRIVPIHSRVRPIVEKYYKGALAIRSDFLFNDLAKKYGNGLSYNQYKARFKRTMEVLGFRSEITPHYTRHTFISMAKARDVKMDDNILKQIVGHKSTDVTENVYTHRTLQDLKEEMELIK